MKGIDALDAPGGTWRLHSYPGLACDVWAHSYSFSYAPNPDWSASFVEQPEIQAYLARCADEFGLRDHMRFYDQDENIVYWYHAIDVHGQRVTCPLHNWVFDLNTGEAIGEDARIEIYPVRVEAGRILLDAAALARRSAA